MSSLFSKPAKPAAVTPAPPAPERSDAVVQDLAAEQRKRYAGRGAGATTLLTGGLGASGGTATAATLLGSGGTV